MIAAFDAHYCEDDLACAAAVLFEKYRDEEAVAEYCTVLHGVSPYLSGQFYRRELPCILQLWEQFDRRPDEIVIDGYVMLGDKPGLGRHLFEFFGGQIPVIGVAKSRYRSGTGIEVFRGGSIRPLYVTSAGIDAHVASDRITAMHGPYRLPTMLKRVDALARQGLALSR